MDDKNLHELSRLKQEVYGHGRTEQLIVEMTDFYSKGMDGSTALDPDMLLKQYKHFIAEILHIYAEKQDQRFLVSMNRNILKELVILSDRILESLIDKYQSQDPNFEHIKEREDYIAAHSQAHQLTDGYLHKK